MNLIRFDDGLRTIPLGLIDLRAAQLQTCAVPGAHPVKWATVDDIIPNSKYYYRNRAIACD
jgi:hypothetical protein